MGDWWRGARGLGGRLADFCVGPERSDVRLLTGGCSRRGSRGNVVEGNIEDPKNRQLCAGHRVPDGACDLPRGGATRATSEPWLGCRETGAVRRNSDPNSKQRDVARYLSASASLAWHGRINVILLPTDEQDRLSPQALREELTKNPDAPTIVLLQAGDINIGAFDSFESLVPIAKQSGAWVHIDGAFGLWAAASQLHGHLLRGASEADSWATDGHKWLNVPYDSGYAFVADSESHRASMTHRAAYIYHDADARDQIDWNPEWSRRARGFATYAALRQLGRQGVTEIVDDCCRHAKSLATKIGALPGAQLLWTPVINQGLVRFLNPGKGSKAADHDKRTEQVVAAVLEGTEAFFGCTTWHGMRAMRISVCGWQTNEQDVERAVGAVEKALRQFDRV